MPGRVVLWCLLTGATAFAQLEADASRGQQILNEKGCTGCHAVAGAGATVKVAALTRPLNREYTPAGFAATLWNHAPQMFSAIRKEKGAIPQVSEREAADLFAYFASLRYFEPMGEAARGARLVHSKKCAECHFSSGPGALVETWSSLRDPLEMAAVMWNHQPRMQAEMTKRGLKQQTLTAQDLSDFVVYVRGLPKVRAAEPAMMQMPSLCSTSTAAPAATRARCPSTGSFPMSR
jgi:cytochrome c2